MWNKNTPVLSINFNYCVITKDFIQKEDMSLESAHENYLGTMHLNHCRCTIIHFSLTFI